MSALAQVGYVARRSIVRTARQPANIIFPFVFPTALLAVTSAGLSPATKLPGFPSKSFLAFFLAFPFIQGALFATMERPGKRRPCYFCKEKIDEVDWKNFNQLRRYVSEKGKIRSRRITGTCRRHQRQVAVAVKRAREMALLPYVSN